MHEQNGDVVEASATIKQPVTGPRLARLLLDNYLTLTMEGRAGHALLGAFPADAPLSDGNLAAALAIDNIVHGVLDEGDAHFWVSLGGWRRRRRWRDGGLRRVPGGHRGRARPPAQ